MYTVKIFGVHNWNHSVYTKVLTLCTQLRYYVYTLVNYRIMEEIPVVPIRIFRKRLSHYMCLIRDGKTFRIGGIVLGAIVEDSVTTPVTTPNAKDCLAQDTENRALNENIDNLTDKEKEEARDSVTALCSNCKNDWDINKTPCFETWNEDLGETVIVCDECLKFKSGGNKKVYKSLISNMRKL